MTRFLLTNAHTFGRVAGLIIVVALVVMVTANPVAQAALILMIAKPMNLYADLRERVAA